MSAASARVPSSTTPWGNDEIRRTTQFASAATYYPGQMMCLNSSGVAVNAADTSGLRFDGLVADSVNVDVLTNDTEGRPIQIKRPWRFTMAIASAVAGDEGRPVYVSDNQTVAYSTSNSILVGWVDQVLSSTSVLIIPTWGPYTTLAVSNNTLTFAGTTGQDQILMPDNLADALSIQEGSNKYVTFKTTNSAERVYLKKQTQMIDSIALAFGDGDDITMTWDGTDLLVAQALADSNIKWGVSGAGINHIFYGDTATRDMQWDQSNDQLLFLDNTKLAIGTGAGAAGDITFSWDATRLNVNQLTADSEIRWGVDGAGIDQRWYGDTASADMLWDQSADCLIFEGVARVQGLVAKTNGATAITTTRAVTRADSGGIFTVAQTSAYTITVAQPTQAGERYLFQLVSAGAFNVQLVATGCTFEGTITIDAATIPATGSTLTFATGASVLGDSIELVSTSTTKFFVRAIASGAGGITIA